MLDAPSRPPSGSRTSSVSRYTSGRECPICGGSADEPRGQGVRCIGYLGDDGRYARCSRESHAGGLPLEPNTQCYVHLVQGDCRCGRTHGYAPSAPPPKPAKSPRRPLGPIEAEYVYEDEQGRPYLKAVRHRDGEGKTFRQFRALPEGDGFRWMIGTAGLPPRASAHYV